MLKTTNKEFKKLNFNNGGPWYFYTFSKSSTLDHKQSKTLDNIQKTTRKFYILSWLLKSPQKNHPKNFNSQSNRIAKTNIPKHSLWRHLRPLNYFLNKYLIFKLSLYLILSKQFQEFFVLLFSWKYSIRKPISLFSWSIFVKKSGVRLYRCDGRLWRPRFVRELFDFGNFIRLPPYMFPNQSLSLHYIDAIISVNTPKLKCF